MYNSGKAHEDITITIILLYCTVCAVSLKVVIRRCTAYLFMVGSNIWWQNTGNRDIVDFCRIV